MRSGLRSRMVGIIVIPFLLFTFCLPVSLQAYVPNFFFGAVLIFIAFDLMLEWLWHSRLLVTRSEYAIILITFAAITATTLIIGFAIGCGCCVLHFLFLYARSSHVTRTTDRSSVSRGFNQRRILAKYRKAIVVHRLSGYIFFGSAVSILDTIKASIKVHNESKEACGMSENELEERRRRSSTWPEKQNACEDDEETLTHFLLLDFDVVNGVDATAARSLFVTLVQTCQNYGITLVTTGLATETKKLLDCHGVTNFSCFQECKCLDEGLQYCEDSLLAQIDPNLHPQRLTPHDESLEGVLTAYLAESSSFPLPESIFQSSAPLSSYFKNLDVNKGDIVFRQGEPSETLYFIYHGSFLLRRHAQCESPVIVQFSIVFEEA